MRTRTKAAQAEIADALTRLHGWVKPGDTVYTVMDHVSSSGMSRAIRVVLLSCSPEGKVADLHPNWAVGKVLGLRHWTRHGREQDALVVSGAGMDMGFHVVYSLARTLYPDGFGYIGVGCPSNDHTNGDRDYTPHSDDPIRCVVCSDPWPCRVATDPEKYTPAARKAHKAGEPRAHMHSDGGYALRHRWL